MLKFANAEQSKIIVRYYDMNCGSEVICGYATGSTPLRPALHSHWLSEPLHSTISNAAVDQLSPNRSSSITLHLEAVELNGTDRENNSRVCEQKVQQLLNLPITQFVTHELFIGADAVHDAP
jgi:hypothetical protein